MKLLTAFIIVIFCSTSNYAWADPPEAYVVTDGPTLPVGSVTEASEPPPAPDAATPTETDDGKVEYNIVASKPPCSTSTCITNQTIANAKHAFVQYSPVKSYIDLIKHPTAEGEEPAECTEPTKTGMTIYRQVVDSGTAGRIVEVEDAFCVNQGCVYFGGTDNEECRL